MRVTRELAGNAMEVTDASGFCMDKRLRCDGSRMTRDELPASRLHDCTPAVRFIFYRCVALSHWNEITDALPCALAERDLRVPVCPDRDEWRSSQDDPKAKFVSIPD